MKVIILELYKLRRKHLFLMITLFLLVEMTWAFMATSTSIYRNPENARWEPLIAMVSSMNSLFLPILSAICVSRICDMEHKGNTWKLLQSLSVKRSKIYKAKFICGFFVMVWACIIQVFAMDVFGVIKGFEEPVPFFLLARFFIGSILTNAIIIALQQWASIAVKNQAFPLFLGMIGGFIGMAGDFFPPKVRRLFLWSYYTGLSPITQNYTNERIHFIVRDISSLLPVQVMLLVIGIVIYLVGSIHVSKQEV